MSCAGIRGAGRFQHVHPLKCWYWLRSVDFVVRELWWFTTTWPEPMPLTCPAVGIQIYPFSSVSGGCALRLLPRQAELAVGVGQCKSVVLQSSEYVGGAFYCLSFNLPLSTGNYTFRRFGNSLSSIKATQSVCVALGDFFSEGFVWIMLLWWSVLKGALPVTTESLSPLPSISPVRK